MAAKLDALARELPIGVILPELLELVPGRNVVIEAPPGAGKTTVIPAVLLERGVLGTGQILVLQPRRLAARLSALRTAALLGEPIGGRVGYRVRFDHAGDAKTRLWFMTEGVLVRRLRDDPQLAGVDAVILDEFHERHLDADLLLALLRRQQQLGSPLRLLAMSATLDAEPVAEFLDAARLRTDGRSFPVEVEHRSPRTRHGEQPLERRVAGAVRDLIERGLIGRPQPAKRPDAPAAAAGEQPSEHGARAQPGHALVFLPGARETQACARECAALAERAGLELLTLHGQLPRAQQDHAVAPSDTSKLILSTNVAETSITIDGVVAVIDSGQARVADFDPGSGLPRVSLGPISRASAAQRAGRAGRTRAGVCIRLYGQHDHDHRPEHQLPELRRLDLAGPVLELAAAGIDAPDSFEWFEAPSPAALAVARELLGSLGAIDEHGRLTGLGRAMLNFPLHPRLARLLVAGIEHGVGDLAAAAAALLAERPLRRPGPARACDSDILDEIELLEGRRGGGHRRDLGDPGARATIERATKQLRSMLRRAGATAGIKGPRKPPATPEQRERALRLALLAAHPDRVATVRVDEHDRRTLVFAFGGSAELSSESGVRSAGWVIALRNEERREGTRRRAVVHSAAAIEPEWLIDLFADAVTDTQELRFDAARERVVGESALRYGKLTIERSAMAKLPEAAAAKVLLEAARNVGAARFCGGRDTDGAQRLTQLRLRARFINTQRPEFPLLDDALIDEVLASACEGLSSFAELELLGRLSAQLGARAGDHRALDRLAPTRVTLPGGRKLTVNYEPDRAPWVGSRLQDFFGMPAGPRVLDGAVPVVLHLRAPNRHDVAV
ncbi:ATP-dependent helicase C-terminal domain-containing protein, partial [Enhygromyxa salina]|uniref:ATP-dependent helicase C-terminal domain-containing protein n=1 Tax=Enhygromyxa salina TaxID=215803 RepID=UPI0006964D26